MIIKGNVKRILHEKDNGWCVMVLKCGSEEHKVAGVRLGSCVVDSIVEADGDFTYHDTFGKQFTAKSISPTFDFDRKSLCAILNKTKIKGLGPKTVDRIVNQFGDDIPDIIENEHGKLTSVKGVSREMADGIEAYWKENFGTRKIIMRFGKFDIGINNIKKIYERWGLKGIDIIEENPYNLTEINGIGFETADKFALSFGVAPDDPRRVSATILYVLYQLLPTSGHVFGYIEEVINSVKKLISIDSGVILKCINAMAKEGKVVVVKTDTGEFAVYHTKMYLCETYVADAIKATLECEKIPFPEIVDVGQDELTDEQFGAVRNALVEKISIVTGGPGTGKSHCIKKMVEVIEKFKHTYKLLAPTGRAAKRMEEVTGRKAATIHRCLRIFGDKDMGPMEEDMKSIDFIIVDESSMIDILLANTVFERISRFSHLIIVGDIDQLSSIGPGNFLKDLVNSGKIKVTRLNTVFRQAEGSDIVVSAHKINKGNRPDVTDSNDMIIHSVHNRGEELRENILNEIKRMRKKHNLELGDIQVITPQKNGVFGVVEMNKIIQNTFNPPKPTLYEKRVGSQIFRENDRVMHIKNNYDLGVFNGDVGYIVAVGSHCKLYQGDEDGVCVQYDTGVVSYSYELLSQLTLAYAITVHKSQGSEYKCVFVLMTASYRPFLTRNLAYTAVTRAKRFCIVYDMDNCLHLSIVNNSAEKRNSGLLQFLNS